MVPAGSNKINQVKTLRAFVCRQQQDEPSQDLENLIPRGPLSAGSNKTNQVKTLRTLFLESLCPQAATKQIKALRTSFPENLCLQAAEKQTKSRP
jgi:hypothetical protein